MNVNDINIRWISFPQFPQSAEHAGIITRWGMYTQAEQGHARKHPILHRTPFASSRRFYPFVDLRRNATPKAV